MNKLELKHIAPYLPYGLEVQTGKSVWLLTNISSEGFTRVLISGVSNLEHVTDIKPILRPMSDLFKLIDWDNNSNPYMLGRKMGLIQITEDGNPLIVEELYAEQCESPGVCLDARYCNWWLFEHHFDVFGLLEKGLAIDKNTIE